MRTVTITLNQGLRAVVNAENHQFFVDEPRDVGGEDSGPNPYDLLLSALGACTAMTLRLYADHKKWDLQAVRVVLEHDRVHLRDCRDCEGEEGPYVDTIQRVVHVTGDLDQEQRERLLEIADRCPVARTLKNGPRIRSRLG